MAVIAGAAASEAEMREMVVARTGTDAEIAIAVISPFTAHPNHSFKGSQMDCYKANRPLWSIVQICIWINVAVQWCGEQKLLCVLSSPRAMLFVSNSPFCRGALFSFL